MFPPGSDFCLSPKPKSLPEGEKSDMARRSFFATRSDLETGLCAIEAQRPLGYIRFEAGRYLDSPDLPIFDSLREIGDLGIARSGTRSDSVEYLIVDADTPVSVQEIRHTGRVLYQVEIDPEAPALSFEPGGLFEDRVLLVCEFAQVQLLPQNVDLYRLFTRTLTANCIQAWSHEYAPDALAVGKQGIRFAWDLSYGSEKNNWTIQDVEEQRAHYEKMVVKKRGQHLNLEETWDWLEEAGYEPPRNQRGKPKLPTLAYLKGDEDAEENEEDGGLEFFRTNLNGDDLSGLTLPRLYVGRTGMELVDFRATDLQESAFRWNDWLDCDFTGANLSRADLRASLYIGCHFTNANLPGADFRHAYLYECEFAGADMTGVKMTREQGDELFLTDAQRGAIRWMQSDGPEPPGG